MMISRIDVAVEAGKLEMKWISYGTHKLKAYDMAWNYYFYRLYGSPLLDEANRIAEQVLGRGR